MTCVHERSLSFALLGLVGYAACNEPQYGETKAYNDPSELAARPKGERQTANRAATPLSPAQQVSTANKLAEARCDRERRCDNVGEGRKYASQAKCLSAVASEWRGELDDYECPGGTVQGALDQCLTEIRNEGCMNPVASLERIVDCDAHEVCRDADPRP
jgi:hypothetical protein